MAFCDTVYIKNENRHKKYRACRKQASKHIPVFLLSEIFHCKILQTLSIVQPPPTPSSYDSEYFHFDLSGCPLPLDWHSPPFGHFGPATVQKSGLVLEFNYLLIIILTLHIAYYIQRIKLNVTNSTYSSISMTAFSLRCLMNSAGFCARPRMAVFPASPRHIAQTMVLFPVPFGPIITFKRGPGSTTTESYVL